MPWTKRRTAAAAIQKIRARRYLLVITDLKDAGGFGPGRPARDQAGGLPRYTGAAAKRRTDRSRKP